MPPLPLAAGALGAIGAGLAVLALWSTPTGLVAGTAVLALGVTFTTPAFFTAVFTAVPEAERGAASATLSAAIDIGLGLGPILLGVVAETGGIPAAMALGCLVAAAGAAWTRVLRRAPGAACVRLGGQCSEYPREDRMTFGARVHAAVRERGPLCAGIDPHAALLHEWGLDDSVAGLERFALAATEALAPTSRWSSRSRRSTSGSAAAGWPSSSGSIADGPRGRRAGAARRQARRHRLDQPGVRRGLPRPGQPDRRRRDHRQPVPRLRLARPVRRRPPASTTPGCSCWPAPPTRRRPRSRRARTDDGRSVTGTILDHLRALNAGAEPLGSFGAVVGATIGDTGEDFAFNGPILAPGYGAQGGTAADLPRIFGAALPAVLPSSSRELLRVGPDAAAMRDAARRTNDELRALLA